MKNVCCLLLVTLLLGACKQKRIVVLSKGTAEVNTDAKTVKAVDGSGHEEKEVIIGSGNVSYKISSPAGEQTVELPGDGLFIINAKSDTVIGGIQAYADPNDRKVITQAELKHRIDSMTQLSQGSANAAQKNFYILPNQAVRISDNIKAMVVGPYHRMRSAEKVDGQMPEVYHFYSIKEFREKIEEMKSLTVAEKQ